MRKSVSWRALIILSFLTLGACAGTESQEDSTKATLTVGTLDAGIGSAWLEEAAARFEELYKDSTDFEEGKTGVSIQVKASRSYDGEYLLNQTWNHDIMFTEAIDYYALANSGKIMDITDLMTADLSAYGDAEGTTILSKIDESYASFLNKDGHYYGVPFYDTFYGFVYDIDLWQEDGLYLKKGGGYTSDLTQLSDGPDGEAGTSDDGMPATYDDLIALLKLLTDKYGYAFVISNDEQEYVANMFFNFWAMNEGYDGMNLQYKLSTEDAGGVTATNLIESISSDGTVTYMDETTITYENAYLLQNTEAKLQALEVLEAICTSSGISYEVKTKNTEAQSFFIQSRLETDNPCPMCIEGSWFENEARSYLEAMDTKHPNESHGHYALMPIPRATEDQVGTERTRLGLSQSYGVINANCTNAKLAYEFMKFLHSDAELVNYTVSTGMTKPYHYEIPDDIKSTLSTYTLSLIEVTETHKIFYPYANNPIALNNYDDFGFFHWAWNMEYDGASYTHGPWAFFRSSAISDSEKTAQNYWEGTIDYFKTRWSSFLKRAGVTTA